MKIRPVVDEYRIHCVQRLLKRANFAASADGGVRDEVLEAENSSQAEVFEDP